MEYLLGGAIPVSRSGTYLLANALIRVYTIIVHMYEWCCVYVGVPAVSTVSSRVSSSITPPESAELLVGTTLETYTYRDAS